MGRSATLFSKLTCSKKPSESTGQRADRQTISNGALWSFTRAASQSSYRIRAGFFGFRSRVSKVDMCAAKGHAALLPKADMCCNYGCPPWANSDMAPRREGFRQSAQTATITSFSSDPSSGLDSCRNRMAATSLAVVVLLSYVLGLGDLLVFLLLRGSSSR